MILEASIWEGHVISPPAPLFLLPQAWIGFASPVALGEAAHFPE